MTTNVGEDMGKQKILYTYITSADGHVSWLTAITELGMAVSKLLKLGLPHDSAIPFLSAFPKEI